MLESSAQSASAQSPHRRLQGLRVLFACCTACLLALDVGSMYGSGAAFWSSPLLLISILAVCVIANGYLLPAGFISLANIFLVLLFLFHMGYYLPARLGVPGLSYMPPVYGSAATRVVTLFCGALLALEFGYLLAALHCSRCAVRTICDFARDEWTSVAFYSGCAVSALSFLALMVFIFQTGGPMAALQMSYSGLFTFLGRADSRFAFTAMWYSPIGLLLWRVGMIGGAEPTSRARYLWCLSAVLLLGPFLLIGSRGPCVLFVIGLVYLRHVYVRRYRAIHLCAVASVVAFALPLIASYRNLPGRERVRGMAQWQFDVVAPLLETGSTYRPYYGIVEMLDSGQQDFLHGQSYWIAARNLIPNVGPAEQSEPGGYYRTSAWFNYRLSPADDAAGVGIGCSMIAEQYANFGYLGVLGVFAATGVLIVALESHAVVRGSMLACVTVAVLVLPLCWYIRDDVFGCLRMFVWPMLMLLIVRVCRLPLSRRRLYSERESAVFGEGA